jgi:hypothetical protein
MIFVYKNGYTFDYVTVLIFTEKIKKANKKNVDK